MIVNRIQMADVIGVSTATISKMVKDGCPYITKPSSNNGVWEFDTAAVHQWAVDQAGGGSDDEKALIMKDAKLRDAVAQADLREIERAVKQRTMVRIEDIIPIIEEGEAIVKSRIQAIPGRLGQPISIITDAAECTALLKREVNEALEEICRSVPERLAELA